ncbi:hypothetical protein [Fodinibius salsisoli]|uniref:DUF4402 domain-containing protein n=1 Tax=Fodinibius salsisoli TaxID=2820877 RepID=A0ABT3PK11_9BACT|nr:hypothetical protein [Fodinibius salsisoli]MCW9706296.1 hypothetical protein [Fodinibius salsisoli]
MKQIKKILSILLLLVGLSTVGWAQQNDTGTITASADVVQQLAVEGVNDLLFQLVSPGVDKTIDLEGNVSAGTATGGEQAGQFTVSASEGASVTLEFTALPAVLTETSAGTETMPITYESGWDVTGDGTSTTTVTTSGSTTIGDFPANDVGGTNLIYVLLGGTVQPIANQVQGTYEADITLTATYN